MYSGWPPEPPAAAQQQQQLLLLLLLLRLRLRVGVAEHQQLRYPPCRVRSNPSGRVV